LAFPVFYHGLRFLLPRARRASREAIANDRWGRGVVAVKNDNEIIEIDRGVALNKKKITKQIRIPLKKCGLLVRKYSIESSTLVLVNQCY